MPRINRLTVADLKAFRPERRLSGTYFSLGVARSAHAQVACVVSKKVAMHATDRNKVKRRARAVISARLATLLPLQYVFYAKKGAAQALFSEIQEDLVALIKRTSA
jgi:ribonuclease P protein component